MAQTKRKSAEELFGSVGRKIDELFDPATVDELQVQAALGRMEARDRMRPVLDRLVDALDEVRRDVEGFIADEVKDPLEVRRGVEDALHDLKGEIDSAPELH